MFIGDLLVARGLVTPADILAALEHQKQKGGRLGDALIALGKLKPDDLNAVLQAAPPVPMTIADTGIDPGELMNLVLKAMFVGGAETPSAVASILKIPNRIIQQLFDQANERKIVDVLGAAGLRTASEMRYTLTEKGKQSAQEALDLSQYLGPAPVSLAAYQERIALQSILNERVDAASINRAFGDLIISGDFVQQIGPAINSGRSMLVYGPPGNGKTSVAERIGQVFREITYIPHCFEVEGQIIKVFDPGLHQPLQQGANSAIKTATLRREEFDGRWVACRRPFVVVGGELTLEMLDLSFNKLAKFYEAPLHVKALGGIFMIDDFGRQIVKPEALLNRWIVPLDRKVDYLKLHTGKSFSLPFDELVIFSTNLEPQDLMDPAFLRRIPYKLEIGAPAIAQYREIFRAICKASSIEVTDETIAFTIATLRDKGGIPLACYQPKFILDQIKAACKFAGVPPQFRPELLTAALRNIAINSKAAMPPAAPAPVATPAPRSVAAA